MCLFVGKLVSNLKLDNLYIICNRVLFYWIRVIFLRFKICVVLESSFIDDLEDSFV